ncbi:MAG TPA: glycogen synthase GlgA [Rudaea sp.]|jgi:starch synthase|uniref:glycogen synthase GlgA n=1 Tax=Rudaea sp. TaxID=2136325 RepID=UPI002F933ED7
MRVLSVASEIFPLIKTGGLADVVGALPGALAPLGVEVRSLLPGYPALLAALKNVQLVAKYTNYFGGPARILSATASGLDLFVLEAKHLFGRPGNPYTGADGKDWPDNALRFAALARAGANLGQGAAPDFVPDIVQAHDWQAGLVPAYLRYDNKRRPATVATVHNLAFQGQFDKALLSALGLPPMAFAIDGVEYYGTIGYLKAALQLSDRITTVSPTYALEIRQSEAGMGLDGLLRARGAAVSGILNGVDTDVWNPASDEYLAARYDARRIAVRAKNKAALQARMDLSVDPDLPLFGVVSRLSWQKGLDLLHEALPALLDVGQLALLGAGEKLLEQKYTAAARANTGRVGCVLGYDEELAHLIQAGADVLLVPSRFEPCGLTQLCALRYGAVPLVARVGGLNDTIIDASEMALAAEVATGIQFAPVNAVMLDAAIRRTALLYRDKPTWKRLQLNGMRTDVSWAHPAQRYAALYRELLASLAA